MSRPRRRLPRRADLRLSDWIVGCAVLALLFLVVARLDRLAERQLGGQAVVADGDTLTVAGERLRLKGIDAPELAQVCERSGSSYPCGREARQRLVDLIGGQPVTCTGSERDRYGRLLVSCLAGNMEINRALVRSGWATVYGDYDDEERQAREAGEGLWAGGFERPQDWRTTHGGMEEPEHGWLEGILNRLRQMFRPAAKAL